MKLTPADCAEIRSILGGKATGYRYADVAILLDKADFTTRKQATGTHRTWRHPSGIRAPMVDNGHGELLPVYVKTAARAILRAGGCAGDSR